MTEQVTAAYQWAQVIQGLIMLAAGAVAFSLRPLAAEVKRLRTDFDELKESLHKFRSHTLPDILKGYLLTETADARFDESIADRQRMHNQLSELTTRMMDRK